MKMLSSRIGAKITPPRNTEIPKNFYHLTIVEIKVKKI